MHQVKIHDFKFSSIVGKGELVSASITYKDYYYSIRYHTYMKLKTISRLKSQDRILRPIAETYNADKLTDDIPDSSDYKFVVEAFDKAYELKVFL